MCKASGVSFNQCDQRGASPVPFHPDINAHSTRSHSSYSPNIDLNRLTLRPSPSPSLSSAVHATQHISEEEYEDFLTACRYPGPIRNYWADVAERTNRRVFECRWDGCLVFILHPHVMAGVPAEVVAHLGDHCWRTARCLWQGCRERKHVRAEDMRQHLIAHLESDGL
jgi:hypothetical protein